MRPLLFVVLTTACASTFPPVTQPLRYECGDRQYVRIGDQLALGSAALVLRDRGDDQNVFATSTGPRTIEVALPRDPRRDATERVFADGAQVRTELCRVTGGYTDLLVHYVSGESIDQLAREHTNGDRQAAYDMLHQGMIDLQRQLAHDRSILW
ncbi:MAG: hypothetical protein QM831_06115 [Kofleriaceae bacterium]